MQNLRYSPYIKPFFGVLDIALFLSTIALFNQGKIFFTNNNIIGFGILSLVWGGISTYTHIYRVSRTLTFTRYIERLLLQIFLFIISLFFISKITKLDHNIVFFSSYIILYFSLIIIISKVSLFILIKWLRTKGINRRNIMFIDSSEGTLLLKERLLKRKDYGFYIFDFTEQPTIENIIKFWQDNGIHTIYIPIKHHFGKNFIAEIFSKAEKYRIKIVIIPDILSNRFLEYKISYTESQPILEKAISPLKIFHNILIKRIFDIIFSFLFILLIGIWLFPIIAIFIRLDSRGTVFFSQKRYGKNRKIFKCLKFRTMVENSDSTTKTTQQNDPRITPFGKFLRKTSLDETPQFINVFLGDMSIVGPRPHMLVVDDHYQNIIEHYTIRSEIKPGITGLAQISGLRGEHHNISLEMQQRILSDVFYIQHWTFSLDIIIIVKTFILLIKGDKKAF